MSASCCFSRVPVREKHGTAQDLKPRRYNTLAQKPEQSEFAAWVYGTYLPEAMQGKVVNPTPVEKRSGGLAALQKAGDDVVAGLVKAKVVINPQE